MLESESTMPSSAVRLLAIVGQTPQRRTAAIFVFSLQLLWCLSAPTVGCILVPIVDQREYLAKFPAAFEAVKAGELPGLPLQDPRACLSGASCSRRRPLHLRHAVTASHSAAGGAAEGHAVPGAAAASACPSLLAQSLTFPPSRPSSTQLTLWASPPTSLRATSAFRCSAELEGCCMQSGGTGIEPRQSVKCKGACQSRRSSAQFDSATPHAHQNTDVATPPLLCSRVSWRG